MPVQWPGNTATKLARAATGGGYESAIEAPPPSDPGTAFFTDEFASGDTSKTEGGFSWGGGPTVELGAGRVSGNALKFSYGPDEAWQDTTIEQRFFLAPDGSTAPTEVWFEYYLYIPSNWIHRLITRITIPDGTLLPSWVVGDSLTSSGGASGILKGRQYDIEVSPGVFRDVIYVKADSWSGWGTGTTVTNVTQSESFVSAGSKGESANNKFFALWAESYSNPNDIQFISEFDREDDTTAIMRAVCMTGSGCLAGASPNPVVTPASLGTWLRVRIHQKAGEGTGLSKVWINNNVVYVIENYTHFASGGNNYWRNGYLLGWSNSGFEDQTDFYVDEFKVWRQDPQWSFA